MVDIQKRLEGWRKVWAKDEITSKELIDIFNIAIELTEQNKKLSGFLDKLIKTNINCDSEAEASSDLTALALEAQATLQELNKE